MSSLLVGKKAAIVISNSESDNEYDSLYSALLDDREILDRLLNLPCISSNKKRKRRDDLNLPCISSNKKRKRRDDKQKTNDCHHSVTVEQCYLTLPEDMVEDNPLDLKNIKERKDEDDRLTQSTVRHPTWYSRKTINDVEDILC